MGLKAILEEVRQRDAALVAGCVSIGVQRATNDEVSATIDATSKQTKGLKALLGLGLGCNELRNEDATVPKNTRNQVVLESEPLAPAVWVCLVDGKEFHVIDPVRDANETMIEGLRARFGNRLIQAKRLR